MDLLRHVEYVVAVADEGSFTEAAFELGMTQPPLSQGVRRLEARWGVELLERHPKGVRLTPAGRKLLPLMRALVEDRHRLDDRARSLGREDQGWDLGVDPLLQPHVLPILGRLGRDRQLRPRSAPSSALVEEVRSGQLEGAWVLHPVLCDGLLVGDCVDVPTHVLVPAFWSDRVSPSGVPVDLPLVLFPRAGAPAVFDILVTQARRLGHSGDVIETGMADQKVYVAAGAAWTLSATVDEPATRSDPAPARLTLRTCAVARESGVLEEMVKAATSQRREGNRA